ncbi:hypothetical protein SPRG_03830 [Saprolegnia parasitica CBS 223.65]|uniref:Calcineurin-like phosphoesterase domain-containing protein n=1 Tax=Saprolegnia parasitica (strain CBS 223.65) TaxID=695850 RepID=A0A067CWR5_SAPPC|nr:hypothetical protein SPRG_03830 [Saprolegnia parasitica CBS 223.65]KDO31212.1 hypothetical protein SPRG_03830 [Saprolegnia parasitica CBS 223.65]|eukprot:XP_012197817.1 hypothetical protein SPRG_03830 [Saprolegnia parasitica CBS 223.65]
MLHAYAPMTDMPSDSRLDREVQPRWRLAFGALCLVVVAMVATVQDRLAFSVDEVKMSLSYDVVVQLAVPRAVLSVPSSNDGVHIKILQVPDMHYIGRPDYHCRDPPHEPCSESNMTSLIGELIDAEKPHLVVFTGDQIEARAVERTADEIKKAIDTYADIAISRQLAWSMVFGNHDEGASFSRKAMIDYIMAKPYALSMAGPDDIGGVGNYQVVAISPETKKIDLALYFIDTGVSGAISAGQKALLRNMSADVAADDAPGLVFYHIPTPDYVVHDGEVLPHGHQGETVSHGPASGLLETLVAMGDVKATFVGHDHLNDYCIARQAIQHCYGGGIGYGEAYGSKGLLRRARVIELTKNATQERITTWLHGAGGVVSKDKYLLFERHF